MGIVRRQSIFSSIFIYIGFGIGALNIFLLPHFLSPEQFGLTRIIISVSVLLAGFCNMGTLPVITKFFPYYKYQKSNDLLFWVLIVNLAGFFLFTIFSLLFKNLIIRKFATNSPLFLDYFYTIYPYVLFVVLFNLLENYAWNRQQTIVTNFLRETGVRLITLFALLLYILHLFSFTSFINIFSLQFGFALLILLIYLINKKLLNFSIGLSLTTKRYYKKMISFASFLFGGGLFRIIEQYINPILIGSIKGLGQTAIFDLSNYIAAVLLVPQRSLQAIATPLIAQAWKDKDTGRIQRLYVKSTATMLIAGCFLLGIIWLNIDNILNFFPATYNKGKYVVLIIGLANLVELGTGLNYQILINSKIWRLDFYLSMSLVVVFLIINYFLVKELGIIGSAWSMFLSLTAYNLTRYILIWWKFGMQPFNYKNLISLAVGGLAYYIASLIPTAPNFIVDILLKGSIFTVLFAGGIYFTKVSEDINDLIIMMRAKVKDRRRNFRR